MPKSVTRSLSTVLVFLLLCLANACTFPRLVKKLERQQTLTVEPKVLMTRGQEVPVEVRAEVPQSLLKKDYRYGIRIYYKTDKGTQDHVGSLPYDFGEYNFEAGKAYLQRSFSFPFTPSKARGQLMAQGVLTNPKGRIRYTKPVALAPGIRTTPSLVKHAFGAEYIPGEYKNESTEPLKFTIYFDQGLATLKHGFGNNLQLLDDFILSNKKTKRVDILGAHSPDAEEASARNLAARRAVALERYIKQKFETESYVNDTKTVKFNVRSLQQHWDSFLGRVQTSALPKDQVNEILEIVNGEGSFKEKEAMLQKLPSFEYLEMYVYPVLRYAEVAVDYIPNPRKDYEIYLTARKIVENKLGTDALTPEEMQYAASLTPLLAEKKKMYEVAVATHMQWRALNNLGMIYLEQAQKELKPKVKQTLLENAILNFRYAAHRQPTAQLFYNLAIAHHQHGDHLEALHSYNYSVKLGGPLPVLQQVFTDKAALELEVGQYDDAAGSLAYAGDGYAAQYNRALLYFLKENYEDAAKLAQKVLDQQPNDATTHYLLAVMGARTKNEPQLTEHLKKAIQADADLAGKAIEDLEFMDYHKTPAFNAAFQK
ncbi:tetratricopeptide repeat protein [Nibribacter koreensis]|uniref:Tetratricopeptide repeat-containing protein n=1 Tax=Nibribacter koreensis TaxID=1084519 RepID=A0ABP8F7J7_9BACT